MRYEDIKMYSQRCEEHPDHQSGMVTNQMIIERLNEEIDELREYIESRQWVGLTDEEIMQGLEKANLPTQFSYRMASKAIEAKLKEINR